MYANKFMTVNFKRDYNYIVKRKIKLQSIYN